MPQSDLPRILEFNHELITKEENAFFGYVRNRKEYRPDGLGPVDGEEFFIA